MYFIMRWLDHTANQSQNYTLSFLVQICHFVTKRAWYDFHTTEFKQINSFHRRSKTRNVVPSEREQKGILIILKRRDPK